MTETVMTTKEVHGQRPKTDYSGAVVVVLGCCWFTASSLRGGVIDRSSPRTFVSFFRRRVCRPRRPPSGVGAGDVLSLLYLLFVA